MCGQQSDEPASRPNSSDVPTLIRGASLPNAEALGTPPRARTFAERYDRERVLGEGGMGVVLLHRDQQIGRRVAMKVLRQEHAGVPDREARFVREARLQGQLEHPAVVPVYDLGVDPEGATYFTMKRVRGVTLASIIEQLADGDAQAHQRFSRRRLLGALSSACLAVDFAHQHGVVHRDLKPENIMLGDYGEVYLLDWGLAKVGADRDEEVEQEIELPQVAASETVVGALMGTPGYMAPEQVQAQAAPTPAWDVYALGAVLFELLALGPLHPAWSVEAAFASTLGGADARPSVRAPVQAIAPELDVVCVKATAVDPAERYASARELHQAIEKYLGGERDVELRRDLARQHAESAADVLQRVGDEQDEIAARRQGMQELGRALALDPGNEQAMVTLVRLLNSEPRALPAEVVAEMERSQREKTRWMGRSGAIGYASLLLYLPFLYWLGIRDVVAVVGFYAAFALCVLFGVWVARQRSPSARIPLVAAVLSNLGFALSASFFGALVLTPALIAVNTTTFAAYAKRGHRLAMIGIGCLALLVPIALELSGTLTSYSFSAAGMTIAPRALELPRLPTLVVLSLASIATVVTSCLSVSSLRHSLEAAERRLYLYAWHLREFVPASARPATDPTVARRADTSR